MPRAWPAWRHYRRRAGRKAGRGAVGQPGRHRRAPRSGERGRAPGGAGRASGRCGNGTRTWRPHCARADVQAYTASLDADCADITALLQAVRLARSASHATRDLVVGFGELWSTRLFARALVARGKRPPWAGWMPATSWRWSGATWVRPCGRTRPARRPPGDRRPLGHHAHHPASSPDPQGCRRPRAQRLRFLTSIFGDLLGASEIHIWTDVTAC
jgi:hypothetical protein